MKLFIPGAEKSTIPVQYGIRSDCNQQSIPQISFPLRWSEYPADTESFAVTMVDYENMKDEGVIWVHWLIANIPGDCCELEVDSSRKADFHEGLESVVQGKNSWITIIDSDDPKCNRYGGPAPVSDVGSNEYEISIYALNKKLDLENGFYFGDLRKGMRGAVIDEAHLYAFYDPKG